MRNKVVDAARWIAFFGVFLFHFLQIYGQGAQTLGWFGVDIFLVISGFVLAKSLSGLVRWSDFFMYMKKRIARLAPALIFVVILTLGIQFWFSREYWSFADESSSAVWALLGLNNFHLSSLGEYWQVDAKSDPLFHTWSLGLEVQLYAIFGVFALLGLTKKRRLLKLTVIMFFLASALTFLDSGASFFNPIARGWEFGLGYLAAKAKPLNFSFWFPLSGLAILMLLPFHQFWIDFHPGPSTVIAATLTYLTLRASLDSRQRTSSIGLFSLLGRRTYSMYLAHVPVLWASARIFGDQPKMLVFVLTLLGTGLLGVLSHHAFERVPSNPGRTSVVAFASVVTAVVLISSLNLPRNSQQVSSIDAGSFESVMILGDSHAEALSPAIWRILERSDYSGEFTLAAMPGCPVFSGVSRLPKSPSLNDKRHDCTALYQAERLEAVEAQQPDVVFVVGRYPVFFNDSRFSNSLGGVETSRLHEWFGEPTAEYDPATLSTFLEQSLSKALRDLSNSSGRVIFISPIPEFGWEIPLELEKILASGTSLTEAIEADLLSYPTVEYHRRIEPVMRSLESIPNVLIFDSGSLFCDDDLCRSLSADGPLYRDNNHLNTIGANLLARRILEEVPLE